ncbi:MAG: dihydrolipoyllysine-residue acetyltransferase [Pseudomonadota bacterium]|nr:dihydrolipoyllysine-residue acetyltransferase [Pseudomonadota bacterium]
MVKLIIPDLGGASDVTIIEILVKPGDRVELDQSILTLEGEKATMEVPATQAGAIAKILVNVGDKVNVGDVVAELDVDDVPVTEDKVIPDEVADEVPSKDEPASPTVELKTLNIPDLGGADSAQVIECLVNVGDEISIDQPVITLEGEKATMEVPSTEAGEIKKIHLQVGDQIKQGQPMIDVLTLNSTSTTLQAPQASQEVQVSQPQQPTVRQTSPTTTTAPVMSEPLPSFDKVYAGPSVRRYAREFGIDLNQIKGTGHKGRIQKEDLIQFVKLRLNQATSPGTSALPTMPSIDFAQFGSVNTEPLSKIKQITGKNMVRNWLNIPHVTQFGQADITLLDQNFQEFKAKLKSEGKRITQLPFLMKALVLALKEFPEFNASLSSDGKSIIKKDYYHIGIAVDTPQGLVVPVIRDVDQKDIMTLMDDLLSLSAQARESGLPMKAMQGGCMTISNLGGIGGGHFTPIINAPEVAILGVSRQEVVPHYKDGHWLPMTQLPLSLSYDHRVIDGAQAARFLVRLMHYISHVVVELIVGE